MVIYVANKILVSMILPAIHNPFKSNGGGRKPNPKKLMKTRLFGKMLAEKCIKMKEIEPRAGRASLGIQAFQSHIPSRYAWSRNFPL